MDRAKEVRQLYKRIASEYVKEYWGKASPDDKYIEEFLSLLPARAKVLDAGCGAGDSVAMFLERGFRAEGIDLSPEMLAIAKRKVPKARFRFMNLQRLSFKPASFDAVYSFGVFEHIPKPGCLKILKGFARVLKQEGFLFLNFPRGRGEHKTYYPLARESFTASFYSLGEFRDLLSRSGFCIVSKHLARPAYRRGTSYSRFFIIARKD
ncbi:class I SAM-dependent methyltransferase [Candidatus Micrarchaeota archaeon]|nr:class I SAM-dependent methyltransferase [Candidatus Micrarchaeota archaeon]